MQPTISSRRLSRTLADSMTAALAYSSTLAEDAPPVADGNVGSSPNTGRSNVPVTASRRPKSADERTQDERRRPTEIAAKRKSIAFGYGYGPPKIAKK